MKKDYELLGILGRGSFGVVYKAVRKLDSFSCVVKAIPVSQLDSVSQEDSENEVKIMSSLDNPYIVKYFDSFLEDNTLYIVMEFCEKGDLSSLIKSRSKPLPEARIWEIFLQICLGLEYLHRVKVLHRDIKTMNLFLLDDKNIRIGDLGIARVLSSTTTFAHTVVGTPYYLSPELCEEKPYNSKSDVWALGCVLYELCSLKKPFDATNPGALILKILRSTYPPLPTAVSPELRELVKQCLVKDHKKRPDVLAILKRPGIKDRVLASGLVIPENSVLNIARISIRKSIDEPEEEKVPKKKPEAKKPALKPRVRKGAPLESKKAPGYAKAPARKPAAKKPEDEVKTALVPGNLSNLPSLANLPSPASLPKHLKPADEEESLVEEINYEIMATAAPPVPELTFNTVKPSEVTNDSSSDDQSYHSDDRDLFQIKEVDSRLEHTNKETYKKIVHLQRQQLELETVIFHKSEEIIGKIGLDKYNQIHSYFKVKFISEVELGDEEQNAIEDFVRATLGDPDSEVIYEMLRLINLESELVNYKEAAADLKFSMI